MKTFKHFLLLWLLLPLLVGCCPIDEPDSAPYRVVTQIDVTYENGSIRLHRQFFQEESIRQLLDYIRYVNPYGAPKEDPEAFTDRQYKIILTYSDGSEYMYQQRSDRFFRIGDGPWLSIDPQRALYLSGIMGMMPGEIPAEE